MSETRATATAEATPVYPPGRYGRRRGGRRHRTVSIIALVLVIGASLLLTVRLYHQYGQTDYKAQIVGWTDTSDTQMMIEFTVTVPAGKAASCTLRARDYNGNELGRSVVVVRPVGDATSIHAKEPVTTKSRGSVGDILSCQAA